MVSHQLVVKMVVLLMQLIMKILVLYVTVNRFYASVLNAVKEDIRRSLLKRRRSLSKKVLKPVSREINTHLANEIQKIVKDSGIDAIIFGNPLNMDGTKGSAAQSIKDKIKLLCDIINLPMFLWDERLSTVGAFNLSSQLDINVSKRVKTIDQNAAAFILQGAIDYLNN